MSRKEHEAFHQGDCEARDDHDGQDVDELAQDAPHVGQWQEGHDRRRDRRNHRHPHLLDALDDGPDRRFAPLAVEEDRLAHHDGVVDHDADHHDQAEEGDHVDRFAHAPEDGQGAGNRNGHAHAGPEAQPDVEEDPQDEEDQGKADKPVPDQDIDPVPQHVRDLEEDNDVGPLGHLILRLFHEFPDRLGDDQCVFFFGLVDDQQRCLLTVQGELNRVLREPVPDPGQAVQGDDFSLGPSQHHDRGELLARVLAAHRADANLLAPRADGSSRKVEIALPDRRGHLGKGQPVLAQPLL